MKSFFIIRILHTILVYTLSIPSIHAIDDFVSNLPKPLQHRQIEGVPHRECVPCGGSTISLETTVGGNRHGRQLQFFAKLRDGVKDTLTPRTGTGSTNTSSSNEVTSPSPMDTFITSDIFTDNTIGQILSIVNSYPILTFGVIALALVIILPLVVLEAISIYTYTPIFCLFNKNGTTPFNEPCSGFGRERLRRNLGTGSNYYRRHLEDTFLQSYFNGSVESLRIPDMDTTDSNVTVQLMKIVDYGLSDGIFDMVNNVTITNVLDEIANSNNTRPYLTATVLAILPVLILNRVETMPTSALPSVISCSGGNGNKCTRRHRSLSLSSLTRRTDNKKPAAVAVPDYEKCEIEFIQCQIQTILELFDA
jgi:hypothetical protein